MFSLIVTILTQTVLLLIILTVYIYIGFIACTNRVFSKVERFCVEINSILISIQKYVIEHVFSNCKLTHTFLNSNSLDITKHCRYFRQQTNREFYYDYNRSNFNTPFCTKSKRCFLRKLRDRSAKWFCCDFSVNISPKKYVCP